MPVVKRERAGDVAPSPQPANSPPATNGKPLSAIAAARLKAEAAAKGTITLEITTEPVLSPSEVLPSVPTSEQQQLLLDPAAAEERDEDGEEEASITKQNLKLCTWQNKPQHILSDTEHEITVKLSKHTTIALIGCFRFIVLRGAININGANIGASSRENHEDRVHTAYVPATHPISKIRGLDGVNHVQFIDCPEPRPLADTGTLFANIWNMQDPHLRSRSFSIITDSDADTLARPLSPESSPEDWLRAVEDCATDSSIIVTIGAAATGKSTFTRRLLNRLLTGHGKSARSLPAVCYLDLDTSKPEYTTQGQVSLAVIKLLNLGPNFSHAETAFSPSGLKSNEIVRSHPMPPNLVNYKDYYRACVEDLLLAYKSLQSQESLLPLVINTPGSLYTHHCDLLTALLARFKPHHIVHLGDVRANDAEDTAKLHALHTVVAHYRGTIHQIAEHVPVFPPMKTDVELRAMQMQSYFHLDKVKPGEIRAIPWAPRPVSELVPWELCYEETDERVQDFVGFAMYSDPIEPASLVNSLNGSIVQILESTSSLIPTPYTGLSRTTRYRVPFFQTSSRTGMVEPLDPRTSKLVCTAFVRSFDPDSRVVQLVVPRAYDRLLYDLIPERTVLVGGCCEQPEWAYLEDAGVVGKAGGSQLDSSDKLERNYWVSEKAHFDDMGYLNTVRRVRKFQT